MSVLDIKVLRWSSVGTVVEDEGSFSVCMRGVSLSVEVFRGLVLLFASIRSERMES